MTRSEFELKKLYDEIKQGNFQLTSTLTNLEKSVEKAYLKYFHNPEIRKNGRECLHLIDEIKEQVHEKCHSNKVNRRAVYRLVGANSKANR